MTLHQPNRRSLLIAALIMAVTGMPLFGQETEWSIIDSLNDAKNFDEAGRLLGEMTDLHGAGAPFLWRTARFHFNLSDNSDDSEVISHNIYAGLDFARMALAADSSSANAHGFYGILIGRAGEIEGTKQKIVNSYEVAAHTQKAIENDASNDIWQHVMGRWHFALADLSWLERSFASLIYATPPEASFAEAAEYFSEAAKLAPTEIRHFLWLGKSQIEIGNEAEARRNLNKVLTLSATSDSDRVMIVEARDLLDDL